MSETCTARIKNEHCEEHCVLEVGHVDPEYGTDHASQAHPVVGRLRWSDNAEGAIPHEPASSEATEATELDRSRRYLRPVEALHLSDDAHLVHLAVYQWEPRLEEWVTGSALCGDSAEQGPLPEGTRVTCSGCEGWRPRYERMLAPGYRPEDDDPEVLRRRVETAEREVAAARKFAAEMRDFCSPHGVATDYADRLIEAMDREKGEHRDSAADTLAAEWHRRYLRLEGLNKDPDTSATVLEHVRGELVGLRGALGVLLGGRVEGGTADLLGWSYYREWLDRQEAR